VEIPPEVAIKATIKPGSVYYFPHENFTSRESHYFVVINIDPVDEHVILLVCASSKVTKVEKRRENCPAETLVKIDQTQYQDFNNPSIFDCNNVIEQTVEQLVNRLSNGKLKLKTEMDVKLVEQLRRGVLSSRLVTKRIQIQLGLLPKNT